MWTLNHLLEFAGPIGLLCLLVIGFGEARRVLNNPVHAELMLGAVFGGIALMEMAMPITPFPGVIVDLRSVPIVLAGAFLGWRGLAVTMALAGMARLHIGGTGALAGLLSIVAAGYVGAFWAYITRHAAPRGFWQMALLGPLTGISFLGAMLLPQDMAFWFFSEAAPVLFVVYTVLLPLIGMLIQRELLRTDETLRLRSCTLTCPKSGLLHTASFLRRVLQLGVSAQPGTVGGLLVVTPVFPTHLRLFWGSLLAPAVHSTAGFALTRHVTHVDYVGLSRGGQILVPLTRQEVADLGPQANRLAYHIQQATVSLPGGPRFRLRASLRVIELGDIAHLPEIVDRLDDLGATAAAKAPHIPGSKINPLFAKLEASLSVPRE